MTNLIFILFLIVFSSDAIADDYLFSSLGQPDLVLNLEDGTYTIGDALAHFNRCNFEELTICIEIGGTYVVSPKSTLHPFKLNLSESRILVFLPIKKSKKVLDRVINGYELVINDLSGNAVSWIFFSEKYGVIFISIDGIIYWSAERHGIRN